jgi:hypothetical protein
MNAWYDAPEVCVIVDPSAETRAVAEHPQSLFIRLATCVQPSRGLTAALLAKAMGRKSRRRRMRPTILVLAAACQAACQAVYVALSIQALGARYSQSRATLR